MLTKSSVIEFILSCNPHPAICLLLLLKLNISVLSLGAVKDIASMSSDPQNPVQSWIIGSASDCNLVSEQPSVSRHHCRLTREGTRHWIEDLHSTNGTWINGVRLPPGEPVAIEPGVQVTLGTQTPMPWPPAPSVPQAAQTVVSASVASARSARDDPGPTGLAAPAGRVITIGRSPQSDVQVDLDIVSWNHAQIVFEAGRAILEDVGSRNGTSIGRVDNRIKRAPLDPYADIFLGSYKISARQLLAGKRVEIGEAAFHKVAFHGNSMVIGRDPQSDVPLDFPMISWRHARLTREAEGILVEDLGSRNGTFVGGIRVTGKVLARPGQEIGLGSFRFQLLEGGELAQREYYGNLTIEAAGVVVNAPNGRRLIEPVSMTIFPSELVALMGPAGAGKTTLLKALNGYTKPAEGRVLFNGASLYDYYDRFRQQLGYVPQDDIVHAQLTVSEALYFSARLRTDLSDEEIRARTLKVLGQLQMLDKKDTQIGSPERKTLSGGQRKRVNIALELINDTPVLFLDEPTSGLSSYDAESVIALLKELSKQGKTIITTIHQPSAHIYKQFDDLIMINRDPGAPTGSMVYFGPAYPDSIRFFNSSPSGATTTADLSPEMLLSGMVNKSSEEWVKEFQNSRYNRDFVLARSGKQPTSRSDRTSGDKLDRHFDLRQWFALVKRNIIVKMRDRTQAAILLLQAPLFGALIALVFHSLKPANGFQELATKLAGAHFLMVVAAIWFGCNNAARDIVGEWTVYRRERMVTLKVPSYVFSKLAVLFALCVFQCFLLLLIVYVFVGLKGSYALDLLVLVVSSLVGVGLGLCISAFSRTTESAIALLPVVLLPVIALGGGVRAIYKFDPTVRLIANAIPSRWAFEANLLQEPGPDKWIKPQTNCSWDELPDLTDETQFAQYRAGIIREGKRPSDPQHTQCEVPPPLAEPQENPDRILRGDAAEFVIPQRLITWPTDDGNKTARAFEGETKGVNHAVSFRHSFRESMLVLMGMFGVLVLILHGILLKRDNDPQ